MGVFLEALFEDLEEKEENKRYFPLTRNPSLVPATVGKKFASISIPTSPKHSIIRLWC